MALNVTTAVFGENCNTATATPSLAQWDQGQKLKIEGVDLPASYQVEFSTAYTRNAIQQIGDADGVTIPNELLQRSAPITAYIVLHGSAGSRDTEYWVTIHITPRTPPETVTPDPEEMSVIDQTIAALQDGVAAAEAAATSAEGSASDAADHAADAEAWAVGQRAGEDVPDTDPTYHNNSKYYAGAAEAAAEEAGRHEASWESWAQRAETAAGNAEGSATAADQSKTAAEAAAQTATQKATEAGNSAAAAAGSAASARQTVDGAIGAINTAKEGALTAISSAGSNAVGAVEQEGTTQVNRVQTKGDEVIGSIPQDYTDLVDDVADLSRQLSDVDSAIDDVEDVIGLVDTEKTASGERFLLQYVKTGSSIISLDGAGLLNNGNLLPSTMLNKTYLDANATTEKMIANRFGFAIVSANDLNSILKPGRTYHISYDFELTTVVNQNVANKEYGLMIAGGVLNAPYKSTSQNHYSGFSFSFSGDFTIPVGGLSGGLLFYNGGNYGDDIATLQNLVISFNGVEVGWREASNIVLSDEGTATVLYSDIYVEADSSSINVEYIEDGQYGNNVNKLLRNVNSLQSEVEKRKIRVNPIVKNICHRGLSRVAPEDTAPAYVAAKLAGYEYVENDLWFTSDGVPVMVHERDLSLVSDGEGNIDEVTYAYFKSLDFGQSAVYGDKYEGLEGLSFEEFVFLCKKLGLKIYLDCKSFSPYPQGYTSGIDVVVEILEKYRMMDNVSWLVGKSGVASVRERNPHVRMGWTMSSVPETEDIEYLAQYATDGEVFFDLEKTYVSSALSQACHEVGVQVEAWVADLNIQNSVVVDLLDKNIDGLTADGINLDAIMTDSLANEYGLKGT